MLSVPETPHHCFSTSYLISPSHISTRSSCRRYDAKASSRGDHHIPEPTQQTLTQNNAFLKIKLPYLLTALHALSTWLGCAVLLRRKRQRECLHSQKTELGQKDHVRLFLFSLLYCLNIAVSNVSLYVHWPSLPPQTVDLHLHSAFWSASLCILTSLLTDQASHPSRRAPAAARNHPGHHGSSPPLLHLEGALYTRCLCGSDSNSARRGPRDGRRSRTSETSSYPPVFPKGHKYERRRDLGDIFLSGWRRICSPNPLRCLVGLLQIHHGSAVAAEKAALSTNQP